MNINSKENRRKRIADFTEDAIRIAQKNLFGPLANLAEDAAQASILKALEKEHTYMGPVDKFEGWLTKIVKNTCKDMGRKKREQLTPDGDFTNYFHNKVAEANDISDKTEKLKRLRTAVHSLPERDRKLIMLRGYFNLSGKKTGQFLNMAPGTVNVNYMRAKTKLKYTYISTGEIVSGDKNTEVL